MKIAVAGPTGVLGRAAIPMFLQKGHEVRALARSVEKAKKVLPHGVEIVECDLLAPGIESKMNSFLEGCEVVAHLATAIPSDGGAPGAWEANSRLRTEVVRMLLKASLETGVKRYLQQSIIMAYPDCGDEWIAEDTPLDTAPERTIVCGPVIQMEGMVRETISHSLRRCILRGGSFVGPDTFQEREIENLRAGKTTIPCDGSNFLSLIHVMDMASAVVAAIESAPDGSIFNIVDEPLRQREYLDRLAETIGAKKPTLDAKAACPPSWRCSNQGAKTLLNWTPTHGIFPG